MPFPIIGPMLATKFGRYALIGLAIVALLGTVFLLGRCGNDNEVAQVEQSVASAEAVSEAATDAIETIGENVATAGAVTRAAELAVVNIDDAVSVAEVRNAVIIGVCSQHSHRNDPACMPKAENK